MLKEYKAYEIGPDNHVVSRIDLICDNDNDARERVRQLVGAYPIELWQDERFLGLVEPLQ